MNQRELINVIPLRWYDGAVGSVITVQYQTSPGSTLSSGDYLLGLNTWWWCLTKTKDTHMITDMVKFVFFFFLLGDVYVTFMEEVLGVSVL